MYRIVVSVICYDNEAEVIEFAKKLSKQKNSDCVELLVTCNKCKDVAKLKKDLECIEILVQVFNPKENMGYLHGCLYGLKAYDKEYDYAMISNTDIDFVSDDFFTKLIANDYDSKIACIGPDITLKATGKHQNPFAFSRPGSSLMRFRKVVYQNYLLYNLYSLLSKFKCTLIHTEFHQEKRFVYGVHGSVFLLRKACIDLLLEDDIQIFMYGEELYIAEKLRENQLLSYYDTDLKIIHNENQVTGKITTQRKQEWMGQSIKFLVDRYWVRD